MSRLYRQNFQARFCEAHITMAEARKGAPEELKERRVRIKHNL